MADSKSETKKDESKKEEVKPTAPKPRTVQQGNIPRQNLFKSFLCRWDRCQAMLYLDPGKRYPVGTQIHHQSPQIAPFHQEKVGCRKVEGDPRLSVSYRYAPSLSTLCYN